MVLQTATSSVGICSPFLSHSHLAKMIIMTFKRRTFHTLSWYSCRIFSKPQHITWLWEWVETPLGCWSEQQYCRCWSFVLFFNAVTMLGSVNMHQLYYDINFTDILFQNYLYTMWHTKRDVNTVDEYSNTPTIMIQWLTENRGMHIFVCIFFLYLVLGADLDALCPLYCDYIQISPLWGG